MKTIMLCMLFFCATASAQETYDYTSDLMSGTWTPLNGGVAQNITGTISEEVTVLGSPSAPALVGFALTLETSNGISYSIDAPNCSVFGGCGGINGQGSAQIFATGNAITAQQTEYQMNDPSTGATVATQTGKGGDWFTMNPGCCRTSDGIISLSDMSPALQAVIHQAPEISAADAPAAIMLLILCILIYLGKLTHRRRNIL